jgi:transcriptional regulator with PAS, ATPase and Fis domain
MLHEQSNRREGPFVAVNCGALSENLIEAELFGHERGAFTGAERKRDGRFKFADGGTIFLDEIAELPAPAQAKLLRVLQEGTFEPVGSNASVKVDVRVLSATHRDLRDRIAQGLFREDLYYRINVIEISLPPLRERQGDLPLLTQYFLERFTPSGQPVPTMTETAWSALEHYPYPGNVRELSHAIQHAVVLSGRRGTIDANHLPATISASLPTAKPATADGTPAAQLPTTVQSLSEAVRAFERDYLLRVVAQSGGKKTQAAEVLGISRKTLWEKLKGHGIGPGSSEVEPS